MKPSSVKLIVVLAGALLYNIIFWQEKFALNAVIFDGFILAGLCYLYPPKRRQSSIRWLMAAHGITILTVILHNTLLTKLAFSVTLMLVVAYVQFTHRSVGYAAASGISNYLMAIPSFIQLMRSSRSNGMPWIRNIRNIRILVMPLLIFCAFLILYTISNSMFQLWTQKLANLLGRYFSTMIDWINIDRLSFLLSGLFITAGLLIKSNIERFSKEDTSHVDVLQRQKNNWASWKASFRFDLLKLFMGRFANGLLALKKENLTGIISLLFLNGLLLIVNIIDIRYVWFGFSFTPQQNLSAYVHEGAGMLIFSIVVAMLVLLFFFRGNLNFYKKNKLLKQLAYAWIFQNSILVISVLLRDYYYIQHYGLAYKRIGVLVFLLLVVFGLMSVWIKISRLRSVYYLLKVNAGFAVAVLVLASCIHWDETIARYNLARRNTIPLDLHFLVSLSDKALPLIEENIDLLKNNTSASRQDDLLDYYRGNATTYQIFEERKKAFLTQQKNVSWLSWNYADAVTYRALSKPMSLQASTSRY